MGPSCSCGGGDVRDGEQGVLKGFDQTVNIVLAECMERVYSSTKPVEVVELGVFLIRGDNMCAPLCSLSVCARVCASCV